MLNCLQSALQMVRMKSSHSLSVALLTVLAAACAQPVKPTPQAAHAAPVAPVAPAPSVVAPAPMATPVAAASAVSPPVLAAGREATFVAETARSSGMSAEEIRNWLREARYQQGIINAITRPAEGKPWKDYRPIFITADRINSGRKFYAENKADLDRVATATGVPAQYIVAIIGVETSYGRVTGSYRVLDALYTLGFFYPKREEFFRSELGHLFKLAKEEKLDLATLKGSYAGAMGWGQFMPSSYLNYGKDGDGDGRRDLVGSRRDAFASIANYFIGHGWQAGGTPFVRAQASPDAQEFKPENWEAKYTLAALAAKGYRPVDADAPQGLATLVTLEGANGTEHWIGYQNFYVITRYNRSPMYAMAVHQLAQAIAAPAAPATP
jgi:membrane-bound lytic murein transglycosylase B